jgi:hypothetical protein
MIVCLACRHASPDGSLYCAYCARSLNCRLCEERHRNALGALCCTTCGSLQLSDGTRALRLGWVSALCAGLVALLLWKWFLAHAGPALEVVETGLLWGAAILFNSSIPRLLAGIREGMAWLVMLWMLGHLLHLLPGGGGQVGAWLRGLPFFLMRQAFRLLPRLLRLLLTPARRALWPAPQKRRASQNGSNHAKTS